MENKIDYNQSNEDEISLVDLFAVLIRYRKLIITGTLTVMVLAGLYLFVLPIVLPSLSGAKAAITYNIGVTELPSTLGVELNDKNPRIIWNMALKNLESPRILAALYREQPIFSTTAEFPETVGAYNKMITDVLDESMEVVEASDNSSNSNNSSNSIEVILQVPVANLEKADDFMKAYLSKINESIQGSIIPQVQRIRNSAEAALTVMTGQASGSDAQILLQRLAVDAQKYLEGNEPPLFLLGEPFEIPAAQGRVVKLIIVTFAAFFVTVFIAFVLNAVNNIKADPQASKVISDAWRAGK